MHADVLDREGKCDVDERLELPDLVDLIANELSLLRALLSHAHRDEGGYRKYAKDYGALANSLGFEAYMAQASAMS